MPPVQLARLRPQINALISHYQDHKLFLKTLLLIFENYSEKKSSRNVWLRAKLNMPAWQVPLIVINELEAALEILARAHPQESITLADAMWGQPYYEPKKLAIFLLAKLEPPHQEEFIHRTEAWISAGVEEALIAEVIEQSSLRLEIITSPAWINLVKGWLNAEDKNLQKTGLGAVSKLVENEDFQNLPLVFDLLAPLLSQPRIATQKDLLGVIRMLIIRSQAETASFLISSAELSRTEEAFKFVRKCLPLFNDFFQEEIKKGLF